MSENEKLECLKSLQDVLQKKFELESKVENLPANLRAEEAKLKDANSTYLKLTERYNAVNEEVKSLSFRYEDAFTTRTGYEKQMEFINTQREYEALTKEFDPDPDWAVELVKTAKAAGCKYITLTTRHHDGYSLFDTLGLNEFDAPHCAAG